MIGRFALIVMFALVTLSVAPLLPVAAQDGDIVVRARKLRAWRAVLVVDKGDAMTCRIVRSTGDAGLDARACAAQRQCYETARPAILAAGRAPAGQRRRALVTVNRDMATCFATVSNHIAAYPLED